MMCDFVLLFTHSLMYEVWIGIQYINNILRPANPRENRRASFALLRNFSQISLSDKLQSLIFFWNYNVTQIVYNTSTCVKSHMVDLRRDDDVFIAQSKEKKKYESCNWFHVENYATTRANAETHTIEFSNVFIWSIILPNCSEKWIF